MSLKNSVLLPSGIALSFLLYTWSLFSKLSHSPKVPAILPQTEKVDISLNIPINSHSYFPALGHECCDGTPLLCPSPLTSDSAVEVTAQDPCVSLKHGL